MLIEETYIQKDKYHMIFLIGIIEIVCVGVCVGVCIYMCVGVCTTKRGKEKSSKVVGNRVMYYVIRKQKQVLTWGRKEPAGQDRRDRGDRNEKKQWMKDTAG